MNIFVGNLNPETAAEGLRKLFSEFGEITSSKVIMDNATGMSRGFGFVEMVDNNSAQDAIDNLDFSFFEGNIISVKEAKQNTTRPGQGSYGNSGSGPRPFRPRTTGPRPGGYNNNSGGGGSYNRDNNSGGGGSYNRDNNSGGGSYNRDNNSGGGGSYNRDNNAGSGGGSYNRDNNSGSYNSNFNKNY